MASASEFNCNLCLEDKPPPPNKVAEDDLFAHCFESTITPKFEAPLQQEQAYPVLWGTTQLDPKDFGDLLSGEFKDEWRERMVEYRTQADERVYCKNIVGPGARLNPWFQDNKQSVPAECGNFIGEYAQEVNKVSTCPDCKGIMCRSCGLAVSPITLHTEDTCKPKIHANRRDPIL